MSTNSEEENKQQSESAERSGSSSPPSQSPEPDTRTAEAQEPAGPDSVATASPQWQAIWAPQYNAYYFYNPVTQETTWTNPLQPEESSLSSVSADRTSTDEGTANEDAEASTSTGLTAPSHYAALQAAAVAQGIDPGLAYLDPTLGTSLQGTSKLPGDVPTFTAQFNAHTGRFSASSSRTPGHLSEYERMKRMSEFYFDVNKWEEDLAQQQEAEAEGGSGKKRKRPTKKDLERFKEQKRLKKIAKTAWLRT